MAKFASDQSQVYALTRVMALGKSDDMKRRKLGSPKLQGESLPDLVHGWKLAADEMDGAGLKHKIENEEGEDEERALGQGPLLSALATWFLNLEPGQRRTVARAAMSALHELELKRDHEWSFVMFGKNCPELSVNLTAKKPESVPSRTKHAKGNRTTGDGSEVNGERIDSAFEKSPNPKGT